MGQLFSNLSGASGTRVEGRSAQNMAEFNAAVSEQDAIAIRGKSGFESRRAAETASQRRSSLKAGIATSGGASSPVAGDIAAAQAAEDELEQLLISFEGRTLAGKAESQATLDRLGGKVAKARSKNVARAKNIQFGTQLAGIGAQTGTGKSLLAGF
jgi:hypothetical protein